MFFIAKGSYLTLLGMPEKGLHNLSRQVKLVYFYHLVKLFLIRTHKDKRSLRLNKSGLKVD